MEVEKNLNHKSSSAVMVGQGDQKKFKGKIGDFYIISDENLNQEAAIFTLRKTRNKLVYK